MILIPEMEDVIYSSVAEEKMIQSQTIMKKKEI
jgi:predicted RNA-binding protein